MQLDSPLRSTGSADRSAANQPYTTNTNRRRLLVVGGTLATAGLAGCMGALDSVAEAILKDVNIINGTQAERSGSITVVGPAGETLLSEEFTVAPENNEGTEGETPSTPTFEDVSAGSGEYTVTVSLDSNSAIDGTTDAGATVTVDDPENQHIIVALGAGESDRKIQILVIEDFSDLTGVINESTGSGSES